MNENVMLCEIEEATGITLDSEKYDTFTGLGFDALGMIPKDGKQDINVEISGLRIHISCIQEHQIQKANIQVKQTEQEQDA